MGKALSIIVPCFNEEETISHLLELVSYYCKDLNYELILIDDGSTDKTVAEIQKFQQINLIKHEYNKGKGSAIQTKGRTLSSVPVRT